MRIYTKELLPYNSPLIFHKKRFPATHVRARSVVHSWIIDEHVVRWCTHKEGVVVHARLGDDCCH